MADYEYRAFVIGWDGRVLYRHDLICTDEVEARERAKQLTDGCDIELWKGDKKLPTFRYRAMP
jgi:hypothetical protein